MHHLLRQRLRSKRVRHTLLVQVGLSVACMQRHRAVELLCALGFPDTGSKAKYCYMCSELPVQRISLQLHQELM